MTSAEREAIIAAHLMTPEGTRQFRAAFRLGAAKVADKFRPGSKGWFLARVLAGLPVRPEDLRRALKPRMV